MDTTRNIYFVMGALFLIPLIGFNIPKIFVKKSRQKLIFKPVRAVVVSLLSVMIVFFLVAAFNATMKNRYEIAVEKLATTHAEYLVGKTSDEVFQKYINDNKSDAAGFIFETDSDLAGLEKISFQFSNYVIPRYWEDKEIYEQVAAIDDEFPCYVMYYLSSGEQEEFYVVRFTKEDDKLKIDSFAKATAEQIDQIKMPSKINGKTYHISK